MLTGIVPHVGGPILPPGCPTVLIGDLPAARVGDMATCVGPPDVIAMGAATVLIGGMPAARMGDQTAHGGTITLGCPTVLIGGASVSVDVDAGDGVDSEATPALAAGGDEGGPLSLSEAKRLAAQPGNSPRQRAARLKVAKAFYASRGSTMTAAEMEGRILGIDMSKPVKMKDHKAGDIVHQYTVPGKTGQYFSDSPNVSPDQLGINNRALIDAEGSSPPRIIPKQLKSFTIGRDTTGLESTAAPINDTWSVSGQPKWVNGGATQVYIPKDAQLMQ
jgi:uncharacterized Zn-binding protein involved in type VI secretion